MGEPFYRRQMNQNLSASATPLISAPLISIVIPICNEAGNILPLMDEIDAALTAYPAVGGAYEILFINDGSTDSSAHELGLAAKKNARVRIINHQQRMGVSAAGRNAALHSRAAWLLTCDGDRQNDPADMPRMIDLAWQGGRHHRRLICGLRRNRQDTWKKRIASRIANKIRQAVLKDDCPDTACGLKLFPRETFLQLPFFNGLHRFLPALFKHYGHDVLMISVNDRRRTVGISKSDILGRATRGIVDMVAVLWLMARTPKIWQASEEKSHFTP
jgi:dolichol-phosphate mannosyltransferase